MEDERQRELLFIHRGYSDVPVHDGNDVSLPIHERPSNTSPVNSGVGFVQTILVQPSNANDSFVLIQIPGGLRSSWHEQEHTDRKN